MRACLQACRKCISHQRAFRRWIWIPEIKTLMSQSILFLAHISEAGNTLPKSSYEVLGVAVKLTKQLGAILTIGLIGEDVTAAAETISAAGADRILAVSGPDFATARYASDAAAAEAICRAAGADLILAPATSRFARVLPGVAHRLNGCVDTHVTALEAVNGELRATRWYYRQRIEAVIRQRPQTRLRFRQLHRVGVEAEQSAAGQNFRQDFLRVAAVAERAIHRDFAGLRREDGENLRDHDRAMRAHRSFSAGDDFRNGFRIAAVLLVFVLKPARIFSTITHAAFVRCNGRRLR